MQGWIYEEQIQSNIMRNQISVKNKDLSKQKYEFKLMVQGSLEQTF